MTEVASSNIGPPRSSAFWQQLKTLLWLRWRLLKNQLAKTGKLNLAISMVLIWSLLVTASLSAFIAFALGFFLLPYAQPWHAMIVWDTLLVVFLLMWCIGLLTELQRTEFLSMEKMLQLPISLQGAFFLNYATSLCSLAVLCFVPTAIGLSLAFAARHGWPMLLLIPSVLAFVWMLSAVTYQFRGWLASMMVNERQRRNIIVGISIGFVILSQIPNLVLQLNLNKADPIQSQRKQAIIHLQKELSDGAINKAEYDEQYASMVQHLAELAQSEKEKRIAMTERYLTQFNTYIPFGWPAVVCKQLMHFNFRMFALSTTAMLVLGVLSLRRSYRLTMLMATSANGSRKQPSSQVTTVQANRRRNWLELTLPLLTPHQSTLAIASTLNLLRAPEAKMALIGPFVMFASLGAIFFSRRRTVTLPPGSEGLVLLGGVGALLFVIAIMTMNTFGMDRTGFRAVVLSPVDRKDILIAKNVANLPWLLGMTIPFFVLVNVVLPTSLLSNIASGIQLIAIFAAVCLIGNMVSIYFPIAISSGSSKPVQLNFKIVVVQMLAMSGYVLLLLPGAAAIGIEIALNHFFNIHYLPLYLLLSAMELGVVAVLYQRLIPAQGEALQARETQIMEALNTTAE